MKILLLAVAAVWAVAGFLVFSHPEAAQRFFRRQLPPARVKKMAPVPLAVGLALIVLSFGAEAYVWLARVIGLAGVAKGTFLLTSPLPRVRATLDRRLYHVPPKTLKQFGVLGFALGLALFAYVT